MSNIYTQEQLHDALSAVQDPDDWRNPIDAVIEADQLDITLEAIAHFTGTNAEYFERDDSTYEVTSVGYRNGPCGP